ncbi:MAG: HIT family protein [Candidatus Nomurabacteria bacterium]|nr:HIT family protein [Candidatus Nomurabacteria bacterium]
MAKYEATTKDNKCIFCEIVAGRLPSCVVWEDKKYMAFLAIDPNTEGMSAVIPKKHFDADPLVLPDKELKNLIVAAKKAAQILEKYFKDVGRVGFIIEGMGINHIHIKLLPMHGTDNLKGGKWKQFLSNHTDLPWYKKYDGFISSKGGPMADFDKLKILANKIKKSIK